MRTEDEVREEILRCNKEGKKAALSGDLTTAWSARVVSLEWVLEEVA